MANVSLVFQNPALRFALLTFSLVMPVMGQAEDKPWRSTLYPADWKPPGRALQFGRDAFLQDYSQAGYQRGEKPIPTISGPIFNVTEAPYLADATGGQDSTMAIQQAIDTASAQGGGVVYLPAGTYKVRPQGDAKQSLLISQPNIVFRGDGPDKTHLLNTSDDMRERAIIRVRGAEGFNWRMGWRKTALFKRDELGPTSEIQVERLDGFAVGDWICLRNDLTDDWITEHGVPDWLGQGKKLIGLSYLRKIKAIDQTNGTITIDIPTRYALKLRDRARVGLLPSPPILEVGLEDFSIANIENPSPTGWGSNDYEKPGTGGYTSHLATAIKLDGVVDSWITRVASYQPAQNKSGAHILSNGIELANCHSITIRDCDFRSPQYGGGGGNGYLYRISNSGDNLLQECQAVYGRHGFVYSGFSSSGNVIYQCLDKETSRSTGATGQVLTSGYGSDHHMWFSHSNLIDSCTADASLFVAVFRPFGTTPKHNLTAAQSVFWNTRGTGDANWPVGETGFPLGPYAAASEQWGEGYVIGTQGPRPGIKLGPLYGKNENPAHPQDHAEGEGQGATLQPTSLYADQIRRRNERETVAKPR